MIAAPAQSLDAAAEMGRKAGYAVEILGDALEGEAREVARAHAALALAAKGPQLIRNWLAMQPAGLHAGQGTTDR